MPTGTYAATIGALEDLVGRAAADGDRAGYFPAMYLSVTRTVRHRAEAGRFEDGARMERFVTSFAARYLEAHEAWRAGSDVPEAWKEAFRAAAKWPPIILQHLLLGVNAHINLDLGVTASSLAGAGALEAVRADFDAINDVLAELIDGCQGALGQMSPWLKLVDVIGRRGDEEVIRFSLVAARRHAWHVATRLGTLTGPERTQAVAEVDAAAAVVGRRVRRPGILASLLLWLVRARERATPAEVMRVLATVRPADA